MSTRSPDFQNILRLPHSADASAGERFTALSRQAGAQVDVPHLPVSARLQFLRESERMEALALLADADAIIAESPWELA